jgi:hypothetical protein
MDSQPQREGIYQRWRDAYVRFAGHVGAGVPCKFCGHLIKPMTFYGDIIWRHLDKPFFFGAGVLCHNSVGYAEPVEPLMVNGETRAAD